MDGHKWDMFIFHQLKTTTLDPLKDSSHVTFGSKCPDIACLRMSCGPRDGNQLRHKKKATETWTIKYWLFSRDPYFMVYDMIPTSPGRISSPTNPLNNHNNQGPFFHCSIGIVAISRSPCCSQTLGVKESFLVEWNESPKCKDTVQHLRRSDNSDIASRKS